MKNLELFLSYLCGSFNNNAQIDKQEKAGNVTHPKASHTIGIINNNIKNLPDDFNDFFVLLESYYVQNNKEKSSPRLFLFTENEDSKVVLTSYVIPKDIEECELKNNNDNLVIDYNDIKISENFTPLVYDFVNGGYEGISISNFTKDLKFTLQQRLEENTIYESEVFEKNGKITFGFKDPIIYEKIK